MDTTWEATDMVLVRRKALSLLEQVTGGVVPTDVDTTTLLRMFLACVVELLALLLPLLVNHKATTTTCRINLPTACTVEIWEAILNMVVATAVAQVTKPSNTALPNPPSLFLLAWGLVQALILPWVPTTLKAADLSLPLTAVLRVLLLPLLKLLLVKMATTTASRVLQIHSPSSARA